MSVVKLSLTGASQIDLATRANADEGVKIEVTDILDAPVDFRTDWNVKMQIKKDVNRIDFVLEFDSEDDTIELGNGYMIIPVPKASKAGKEGQYVYDIAATKISTASTFVLMFGDFNILYGVTS